MLVLSRSLYEEITITAPDGTVIRFQIVAVRGDRIRVGITAPKEYVILRSELKPEEKDESTTSQRDTRASRPATAQGFYTRWICEDVSG